MTEFSDQGTGNEEIDVDRLLESVNSPQERAMTGPPEKAEAASPTQTPTVQEYEYDWRGQKVKEPLETILKRASMGRDYNHLIQEHKTKVSEWDKQRQQYEKQFNRYKEVDEYVKQNPEWWQHIEQGWQSREQKQIDPNLKPVLDELNSVKSVLSEWQQEKQAQKISAEDEAFNKEISGIREKYSDLPWDLPDQEGKSLVYKVLEHGTKEGIKSFKTAFMDFYHPELEKRWESRGKEQVVKETQKRTKLGLLGETQAPTKGLKTAQNIKSRSYDDLMKEALEELGIT